MSYVTLTCPVCGRAAVYNTRGPCRCGAYLVSGWSGQNRGVRLLLKDADNTWFLLDGEWIRYDDLEKPR
jgi:hypothetical protein